MFKKFTDWWNKSPNPESNRDLKEREAENIQEEEEEFIYETTLKRDLRKICDLLNPTFPKHLVDDFTPWKSLNSVQFYTESRDNYYAIQGLSLKLKTLKSEYITDRVSRWEMEHKEYEKVYVSKRAFYAKSKVEPLLKTVIDNYENPLFYYIFLKYEDSIHIALNTLKDSLELIGEIEDDLFKEISSIIKKFEAAINKKVSEIKHVEDLQLEAVRKSLIDRVSNENSFMDEFIEVGFDREVN